ncbi:integrase [Glaciimonas sp. PCH181]|nr:integrase [Glaciimonas sp. PCH181]
MPKLATPLTDIQPRTAKPKDKPYKLADGGGLYLLVNPGGSKYWRMGYRFAGTERLLAFGKYPQISLADARKARSAARDKINAGIDPSQAKRIENA